MTRPRRALGPQLPGKLVATQLRVMAAELSDAGRLSRGKRYWADGAVTDIQIEPGRVTGMVQGSRARPYQVDLDVRPGRGAPMRHELRVTCTCPDDDGTGRYGCKHVVAVLFQLSEEVSIDPQLITTWRAGDENDLDERLDEPLDETPDQPRVTAGDRTRVAEVVSLADRRRGAPVPHELDRMLELPTGTTLPDIPERHDLGWCLHPPIPHPYLGPVLLDAISSLDVTSW